MARLEVIVQNERDALEAKRLGADQLELVCAISEGGLTPSYGTIKRVVQSVTIPTMVMVRPHSDSFQYSDSERFAIREDVKMIKELGAAGIVFGCLTDDASIDEEMLRSVIDVAGNMDITFHRAFDEMTNVEDGYRLLCNYSQNVTRILTSGGKKDVPSGIETLERLIALQKELTGPVIMPGGGINADNVETIHERLSADEYHVGSAVRVNRDYSEPIDDKTIHNVRSLIE